MRPRLVVRRLALWLGQAKRTRRDRALQLRAHAADHVGRDPVPRAGHVVLEPRHPLRPGWEGVDVFVRRDALAAVDGACVAIRDRQPVGPTVPQGVPGHEANLARRGQQPQPVAWQHLDHPQHGAVVPDVGLRAPPGVIGEHTPGPLEQPDVVALGQPDRIQVAAPIRSGYGLPVRSYLSRRPPLVAYRPADLPRVRIGRRADRDGKLRMRHPALGIEFGHPVDRLPVSALNQFRRPVGPLARNRLGHLARTELPDDTLFVLAPLTHRRQYLRDRIGPQRLA